MKTKKLYENLQNLGFSKKTKKGLLGVIDEKVDDNTQKVLDKIDAMESKINTTNALSVCIIGSIIAGVVINFLSKK